MGFFGARKKNKDVLDLSEKFEKQQERISQMKEDETSSEEGFNFLGNLANSVKAQDKDTQNSDYLNVSDIEEKKRRLSKRLLEMTNKIEDLSNQIYHLQQRLEVLEKKAEINRF